MNLNITDQEEGKFHSEDEYNLSSSSNITFNVSQDTLGEPNPILAEVFASPPFKIVAVIVYLLLILVGCVLLFLIIHFEQFGGDPQKRSIFNQMFAYLAATELLTTLVTEHIFLARVLFGCLPQGLGTTYWFIVIFRASVYAFLFPITAIYKTVRIFSFRRIAGLNDDFLSIFFFMATIMNCFIFTYVQYMLGYSEDNALTVINACSNRDITMHVKNYG